MRLLFAVSTPLRVSSTTRNVRAGPAVRLRGFILLINASQVSHDRWETVPSDA